MRKKHKNLTACAVAAIFGLSCMVCPVQAKEAEFDGQTDMAGLLEVDETAVPLEEKAEPDTAPAPETGEPEPVTQEQTERKLTRKNPQVNLRKQSRKHSWKPWSRQMEKQNRRNRRQQSMLFHQQGQVQ